ADETIDDAGPQHFVAADRAAHRCPWHGVDLRDRWCRSGASEHGTRFHRWWCVADPAGLVPRGLSCATLFLVGREKEVLVIRIQRRSDLDVRVGDGRLVLCRGTVRGRGGVGSAAGGRWGGQGGGSAER